MREQSCEQRIRGAQGLHHDHPNPFPASADPQNPRVCQSMSSCIQLPRNWCQITGGQVKMKGQRGQNHRQSSEASLAPVSMGGGQVIGLPTPGTQVGSRVGDGTKAAQRPAPAEKEAAAGEGRLPWRESSSAL